MQTLVYKRTHNGDPDPATGVFGNNDCMGSVRAWPFDAVVGVGGISAEPQSEGIAGKLTWIGIGPHRTGDPLRPLVAFEHFLYYGQHGPLLRSVAPTLARRIYGRNVRALLHSFSDEEALEVERILARARKAPASTPLLGPPKKGGHECESSRQIRSKRSGARKYRTTSSCGAGAMRVISRLRKCYKPAGVEMLFVAESPPASRDGEVRFFYNPREERWDHLYRAVMQVVFPRYAYRRGEKEEWLTRFKDNGYFMIDVIDSPVNDLPRVERHSVVNAAITKKIAEIHGLVSRETPIILVKKNVFTAFCKPLRDAGFNVLNDSFLPFPSHGHKAEFITGCRMLMRAVR